jgi:hypothetical protein
MKLVWTDGKPERESDREILSRKIVFLFSRSAARRSLLRLLALHSQSASCILNASKQRPYEGTTSTGFI